MRPYQPYIPQTPGEIWDLLGAMALEAPEFIDSSGYFPGRNIDTEFRALTGGFEVIRKKLGEGRYTELMSLAEQAKVHFAGTLGDDLVKVRAGCKLLLEMQNIIDKLRLKKPPGSIDSA